MNTGVKAAKKKPAGLCTIIKVGWAKPGVTNMNRDAHPRGCQSTAIREFWHRLDRMEGWADGGRNRYKEEKDKGKQGRGGGVDKHLRADKLPTAERQREREREQLDVNFRFSKSVGEETKSTAASHWATIPFRFISWKKKKKGGESKNELQDKDTVFLRLWYMLACHSLQSTRSTMTDRQHARTYLVCSQL